MRTGSKSKDRGWVRHDRIDDMCRQGWNVEVEKRVQMSEGTPLHSVKIDRAWTTKNEAINTRKSPNSPLHS